MPAATHPVTLQALSRSTLVLAGLLLLGVGVADSIAGRTKITQYEELLRTIAVPTPVDPAALFPAASEVEQRTQLAHAKLAFYHLLLTVGQALSGVGFVLIAVGVLRVRLRRPRPLLDPAAN